MFTPCFSIARTLTRMTICVATETGMPCSAPLVFHQTFRVIERFLAGTVSSMISEVRSMQGRQKRPVGDTGELVAYV